MRQEQRHLRKLRHRGAVLRGRAGRTRLPWKRASLLVLLLAGTFAVSIGEDNRSAFAEVLLDPLSLLAQRSPGERMGAVLQTKPDNVNLAALTGPLGPVERVLSGVRTRPPIEFGPDAALLGPIVPDLAAPNFMLPETLPLRSSSGGIPGLPFVGPGPGIAGSPPPEGGIDPPETPETPPPGPAIPEPATWVMMILGMLAVGEALRRRRTRDLDRHAPA